MERGMAELRGEDVVFAWKLRLAERPMVAGTFERAPLWDVRHALAAPAAQLR
jgi:hypothetical protein